MTSGSRMGEGGGVPVPFWTVPPSLLDPAAESGAPDARPFISLGDPSNLKKSRVAQARETLKAVSALQPPTCTQDPDALHGVSTAPAHLSPSSLTPGYLP